MKLTPILRLDRKPSTASVFVLLALLGCTAQKHEPRTPEPTISGDTVSLVTNSPQCAALIVEPVAAEQQALVSLSGRLVWDDDATVRVFTPFAGIVRRLFVDINQPVEKGASLAEIQSADFCQAQ